MWEIERKLALDVARPIIFHNRAATCWHPHVKGVVLHQNSIYNNWRFEDVRLDKQAAAGRAWARRFLLLVGRSADRSPQGRPCRAACRLTC